MGIFGPSKTKLLKRIENLESELAEERNRRQNDVSTMANDLDEHIQRIRDLEDSFTAGQKALSINIDAEPITKDGGSVEQVSEYKVVWKRVQSDINNYDNHIAKLYIPPGATVVQPVDVFRGKSRADYAIVGGIYDTDEFRSQRSSTFGDVEEALSTRWTAQSSHFPNFDYVVGETVTPEEEFNSDPMESCVSGIHFYIDKDKV